VTTKFDVDSGTGKDLCPFLRLYPVSLNPALLHNHFQLDITLIRRTSGRSLCNLKKSEPFQLWGIKTEKISCHNSRLKLCLDHNSYFRVDNILLWTFTSVKRLPTIRHQLSTVRANVVIVVLGELRGSVFHCHRQNCIEIVFLYKSTQIRFHCGGRKGGCVSLK